MAGTGHRAMEDVSLKHDNGADIFFRGRLFAECSWYDEESGTLTRQKLYVTDTNEHIYYLVRHSGEERQRRAYRLSVLGDRCVIRNGNAEMVLQFDMLMLAVRSLCGMGADAESAVEMVEQTLKAANS
ncbi:MAG: hypothetical protein FWG59_06325 [Betaproteobacteria bacterium]|nr:hypothetical protein [Betaproteobacteria bacterium]